MKRRDALSMIGARIAGHGDDGDEIAGAGSDRTKESWDEVVAAGKKEGLVVWSFFGAPGAATERHAREFEQLYGIRVELAPARTGDFEARWNAERAAGKPSIDIRSSGSPENRRLAARGLDQSFGTLPAAIEPGVPWIIDPLVDVKAGNGHTLHTSAGGYFILVNNKLCPPEGGPRSYKDLEDPKYKGLIVLSEPIGPSPGSRWAAYAWKAYGDDHLRQGDRQREGADARRDRSPQADCARRVRHLHSSHPGRRRRYLEVAQAASVPARGSRGRGDAVDRRNEPAEGRTSSERCPCVHELHAHQVRSADHRRRPGRSRSSARTSRPRFRNWRISPRPSRFRKTRTPTNSAQSCSSNGQRRPSRT